MDEQIEVYVLEDEKGAWRSPWGHDHIVLTREQVQALLDGKTLTWCNDEYSTSVTMEAGDVDGG